MLGDKSPQVMGIINVTPDSFSDGGEHNTVSKAVQGALNMVNEGVHWLDVGGESTRPGASVVSEQQELDRVIPVIQALKQQTSTPISIDTSKAAVMKEAVSAGASMINDVCALQQDGALKAAKDCNVPVCLMHMQGKPQTMQLAPSYENVVDEVFAFLIDRAKACIDIGIANSNILFDPGFGFGKNSNHNYHLLRNLTIFSSKGNKVLVGMSRKRMIGEVTQRDNDNRVAGSVAAATLAMHCGAHIIRVHDVPQTMDALKVFNAFKYGVDNK
ncbi:dihydropteroate synthase [Alteromonas sp. 5E99-2]|uniref:dihydropteroate synthase n=1 Tax=Alteromonas sp. 5E99-2 TaxID=2817683 RepID=UPI001A99AD3F|nr:dihydropteroate synthase [Alteromonas sp. 5E99-2]MBO1255415.1 dihydropteroate synthase [Alteromonas sp. 5E99-2]